MNQTTERFYQAVVILKGTPEAVIAKELVIGTQILNNQYTPGKASYVGKFEAQKFKETYDKWVEGGAEIRVFYADDRLEMDDIDYKAASLETVPASAWGNDESVLVLGPFAADRLDFHLENCTQA